MVKDVLSTVFKCLNKEARTQLSQMFNFVKDTHNVNTRSSITPFSPSVLYKGRQLLLPFFYTESSFLKSFYVT